MKKLLYIILLLPLWVNAQTNGTIQKTSSTGTIRGSFGSLGLDTLTRVTGALVNGYILKYHAATNKWYASPDGYIAGLQDSLTKKANRTFDNVASGAIAKAKADTSATGLQTVSNFFPKGDTRYLRTTTAASTYVPYTGATGSVNLGSNTFMAGNMTATGAFIAAGSTATIAFQDRTTPANSFSWSANSDTAYFGSNSLPNIIRIKRTNGNAIFLGGLDIRASSDQSNYFRVTGSAGGSSGIPTTGQGLEITFDQTASEGLILSYNRSTSAFKPLKLYGSQVQISNLTGSVTDMVTIDNAGNLGRTAIPSGGGGGTVVSVGVSSANGFAGTSSGGENPALTLTTTISGVLQGNGTAISAAPISGSGDVVLTNSPTLISPALGTPSALVGTNITGTASALNIGGNSATSTLAANSTLWSSQPYAGSASSAGSFIMGLNSDNSAWAPLTPTMIQNFLSLGSNAYTSTAYAPLASPALTGNPTAPTQSAGDNSTKIATTAYVDRLGGGTVTSGTYTPTITGVSNLASSSAVKCHYIRVGNEVTITGRFTISSTTSSNIVLRISLPIASNLSATGDLSGSGSTMASSVGVYVIEDTTNDEAEFQIATNSTTFVNVGTGFTLSYTVK